MAQCAARNNPQPVINRGLGLYINWRRLLRTAFERCLNGN